MGEIRMERKRLNSKIPAISIRRCVVGMARGQHLNFSHTRQSNHRSQFRKRGYPGDLRRAATYHSESVDSQFSGDIFRHHLGLTPRVSVISAMSTTSTLGHPKGSPRLALRTIRYLFRHPLTRRRVQQFRQWRKRGDFRPVVLSYKVKLLGAPPRTTAVT